MQRQGIVAVGIWCVDVSYKIKNWPEKGKLSIVNQKFDGVGGGPSNVLTNLNYLGFNYPKIGLGCIGCDLNAKTIIKHCSNNNIITKYFSKLSKIETSYTLCMSEKGKERTFFHYPGANKELDNKYLPIGNLGSYLPKILYIGYLTLLGKLDRFNKKNETKLVGLLRKSKKLEMLNCLDLVSNTHKQFSKIVSSALEYCDYLLLNEIEAEQATNIKIIKKNKLVKSLAEKAAKKLIKDGVKKAVILHTPEYALWMDSKGYCIWTNSIKIQKEKIKSTVGAGDAFCAAFIFGVHENWDSLKILKKAHAAARSILKTEASSGNIPKISNL